MNMVIRVLSIMFSVLLILFFLCVTLLGWWLSDLHGGLFVPLLVWTAVAGLAIVYLLGDIIGDFKKIEDYLTQPSQAVHGLE